MNNKVKLIVAVVALAIAGVVVAMNMGLIGGGKPARKGTTANSTQPGTSGTDTTTTDTEAAPEAGQLKKDNF